MQEAGVNDLLPAECQRAGLAKAAFATVVGHTHVAYSELARLEDDPGAIGRAEAEVEAAILELQGALAIVHELAGRR
jgi:hypothetical protein